MIGLRISLVFCVKEKNKHKTNCATFAPFFGALATYSHLSASINIKRLTRFNESPPLRGLIYSTISIGYGGDEGIRTLETLPGLLP